MDDKGITDITRSNRQFNLKGISDGEIVNKVREIIVKEKENNSYLEVRSF